MKLCFTIMAHHQPKIFGRLIKNLAWPDTDIVVHIDKKSDIALFRKHESENVMFMVKRRSVRWGGWSQTLTMIDLLKYALSNSDADYFIFLAGTDFPIQRGEVVLDFLKSSYPKNFLNWYPLVPGIWGYGLIESYRLIDYRSFFWDVRKKKEDNHFGARYALSTAILFAENMLNKYFLPRNTKFTDFYHGSSRWCINRETAEYAVEFFGSHESSNLRKFLKFTIASDELYFATSILNSQHRHDCIGYSEEIARDIFEGRREPMSDEKRVYFHYIDWSPEREDPAVMVDGDFDRLRNSGKFFACKFLDDRSVGVVKRIESEILEVNW
jgi:hypothetical protein